MEPQALHSQLGEEIRGCAYKGAGNDFVLLVQNGFCCPYSQESYRAIAEEFQSKLFIQLIGLLKQIAVPPKDSGHVFIPGYKAGKIAEIDVWLVII